MEKKYGFKMKSVSQGTLLPHSTVRSTDQPPLDRQFPVTTGILDVEVTGPWGVPDSSTRSPTPTPVHLVLAFPEGYPKVQATIQTVEIIGETTAVIRRNLRAEVEAAMAEAGNCMERVLKLVLGADREDPADARRGRMMREKEMDSSESESDDDAPEVANTVLTKQHLQRPCGATFGPSGKSGKLSNRILPLS